MTVMNDFMARVMEIQLETQQQLKEMQTNTQQQIREMRVELARSQKRPMEDEERSETPSLPQQPHMPTGPSSSRPPQPPLPSQQPMRSAPPVPPTAVIHDATPISLHAPVQGGNGSGSGGDDELSRNLELGEGSTPQQEKPSAWQVEKFLKNGGVMFSGKLNPKEANEWLITIRGVFESMDCPMELWVRIAIGAFKGKQGRGGT